VTWVLLLLGFLLLAPGLYVLGPLAGLLLVSRPASRQEWSVLLLAGIGCGLSLGTSGGLADQFVRASGVLLAGATVALTVWRPRRLLPTAAWAILLAAVASALWCLVLGVRWGSIELAAAHDLRAGFMAQADAAANLPPDVQHSVRQVFAGLADASRDVAALLPAVLVIEALLGLALAWTAYHRIARHPLGPAPRPFAAFRFSDQFVWALVAGLALALAPVPPLAAIGANLLLVAIALYAARGAAVVRAGARAVPGPVAAAIVIASVFLLAFVAGGLTLLGVADTWLDFRRRLATPPTGGFGT
jgi:hypothetical protein